MNNKLASLLCLLSLTVIVVAIPLPKALQPPNVQIKDGSVLFWQDGRLVRPIKRQTGSTITHAAILLNGYIYEAVPPRVRKMPLNQYIEKMKVKKQKPGMQRRGFTWFIMQPKVPYTLIEIQSMTRYAESQIGRPYSLRGWNKRETRGVFCSQLASNILEKGNRIKSDRFRESPGSLHKKLKDIYQ